MAETVWYQSMKRLNYHSDIVLRTPTLSSGERMLMMANTDPMNSFNSIMSTAYPEHGKKALDCIVDLRLKANRNILMIHEVKSLNGLFGLQQSFPMTDDVNVDFGQLWAARTVNNCNLVELPKSVSELLTMGDDRKFNFVESMMPLHLRKEAENCLPTAFQFWAIPKVKKRRFEVFIHVILFKQIIQDTFVGNISEEVIFCLIRAGMVLKNANVWKTFAVTRDSSYDIDNTMKYTRKTALTLGKNEERTKTKRINRTEHKKSGKEKNISNIKLKTADTETFKEESLSSDYKRNTGSYMERKQGCSDLLGKVQIL